MTPRITEQRELLLSRNYIKERSEISEKLKDRLKTVKYEDEKWFSEIFEEEHPVFYGDDRIGFHRGLNVRIPVRGGNVTPNYKRIITMGFDALLAELDTRVPETPEQQAFLTITKNEIRAATAYAERYKKEAAARGHHELADILERIPRKGAVTYHEACVFLKLCVFLLRYSPVNHMTLGRFDQYMLPFYLHDKENGVSDSEIFELTEELFLSLNFDTDLYQGVQKGDNGQSMVLGGYDKDGKDMFNPLSEICLEASRELKVIDPKINLRVNRTTPDELFRRGTLLTKEGLGFPQYSNDDVVVPGLVKLGYDYEDALDYTVAACWEFIIPNKGADIPNIITMDFPATVNRAIVKYLKNSTTFNDLMEKVDEELKLECDALANGIIERYVPAKSRLYFLSLFIDGCTEKMTTLFEGGAKYFNFGCHGAGISNAADALAAVKKTVYDDRSLGKEQLLNALEDNFEGCAPLRNELLACPKMGNNDDEVDSIACRLMRTFADSMNGRSNRRGGIFRAGTGSAMEYIYKGEKCPATADGRLAYEPYSSSFSPSLNVKTQGLLSVILSFTKFDMTDIINGGPLTIEVHDTVFRNDDGINKTAMLVKQFILCGGHQLQINAINRDRLLDAQKHPEKYPNLVVRVWGWSGYFNELDVCYQNHIISRLEYSV